MQNKRCMLPCANACICSHMCLYKIFNTVKGKGTDRSSKPWVAKCSISKVLLFLVKLPVPSGLYSGWAIPRCQGCLQPFLHFPPLPLYRRIFSSWRAGDKRIPLAQGQFPRFCQLDNLSGTWQLLGCHQCGPGVRELPRSFINSLLIPLGTEIWRPYPSSRAKLKEKWSYLKGVDFSADLAAIAGPVVFTAQYLESLRAPIAS